MTVAALKSDLHKFIDQIENEHLLQEYYLELKNLIEQQNHGAWEKLSEEQKKELLISYDESEDERNLIDHEEAMKEYKKWL